MESRKNSEVRKGAIWLSKLALLVLLSGLLETGYTAAAYAQMINPFGIKYGQTLTKDDYQIARAAVSKLLNDRSPTIGHYESWSNPASGNHGKFTILDVFQSKGMPCRKVNANVVYSKAGEAPKSFTLDACQLSTGQWKTVA